MKKILRTICFVALTMLLFTACTSHGEVESYITTEYSALTTAISELSPTYTHELCSHLYKLFVKS